MKLFFKQYSSAVKVFIFLILSTVFIIWRIKKYDKEFLNYEFGGIIQEIGQVQGTPKIKVNYRWYNLGVYGVQLNKVIEEGDSIEKKRNSDEIKLFKLNSSNKYEVKIFKYPLPLAK